LDCDSFAVSLFLASSVTGVVVPFNILLVQLSYPPLVTGLPDAFAEVALLESLASD
jgi:hypothetical protein